MSFFLLLGIYMSRDEDSNRCPNCYDTIKGKGAATPTGVRVCDELCVEGWTNGEEQQKYLTTVRKLRALLA